jgi:hypothetical protein
LVKLTVLVSYDLGLHFFFDLLVMEGDDEPLQAAQAATAVAAALKEDRKKRNLERLKREAKAAQRKALASKRLVDEESRKRSRTKSTIGSYFVTSRNANNRIGALHLPEPKESTSRGRGRCASGEEGGATGEEGGVLGEWGGIAGEGGGSALGDNGGSAEARGVTKGEYPILYFF